MVNPDGFVLMLKGWDDSGRWHGGELARRARADYDGGSLNSLNGVNLVKSHERAAHCVPPHGPPRAQAHVDKQNAVAGGGKKIKPSVIVC